jgi:hypothetical protein
MRLAIFIGLQYVAYCINPVVYDKLSVMDWMLIWFVFIMCIIGDIKDLKQNKKK